MGSKIYLVQKETQCFYLHFGGIKIIDFKNCFNSVVSPSNKDLDCIVRRKLCVVLCLESKNLKA